MSDATVLGQLGLVFLKLSLIAIGGSNAALTAYQDEVVGHYHWMSHEVFLQLFATAQLAPGPNVIVVTLIGWKVAGLAGAIVATVAMLLPACALAFAAGRLSGRFVASPRYRLAQDALVPLAIGLILASGVNLAAAQMSHAVTWPIVAASAAFVFRLRANPVWTLVLGALVALAAQYAGLVDFGVAPG